MKKSTELHPIQEVDIYKVPERLHTDKQQTKGQRPEGRGRPSSERSGPVSRTWGQQATSPPFPQKAGLELPMKRMTGGSSQVWREGVRTQSS